MNWLDVLLALILAGSAASGIVKGFARTVVGITAALLALLLATWFYGVAGAIFSDYVSSKAVSNFLGFTAVFLGVVLAGAAIGRLLAAIFKWAGLGWLDRTLGGAFGLLRGLLIAAVVVMAMMAFSLHPPPQSVVDSAIAPYVIDAARLFARIAPKELTDGFHASYDRVRKVWEDTIADGLKKPKKIDF